MKTRHYFLYICSLSRYVCIFDMLLETFLIKSNIYTHKNYQCDFKLIASVYRFLSILVNITKFYAFFVYSNLILLFYTFVHRENLQKFNFGFFQTKLMKTYSGQQLQQLAKVTCIIFHISCEFRLRIHYKQTLYMYYC